MLGHPKKRQLIHIFFSFACLFFLKKSYADEFTYFPVQAAIIPRLSLPNKSDKLNTNLSLGLLATQYHDLNGFGLAPVYQESLGRINGLQVSLANLAETFNYGGQIGFYNRYRQSDNLGVQVGLMNQFDDANFALQFGLLNIAHNYNGAQIGLVNVEVNTNGTQLGLLNVSKITNGVQIGLVNTASDIHGLQLGLVNYAETEEGTSIGLITFIRSGTFRISTTYNSQNQTSVQLESGGKKIYNIVRYDLNARNKNFFENDYWIGFGGNIDLYQNKFFFYPQYFLAGFQASQHGWGLTAKFGYKFSEQFQFVSNTNFTVNPDSKEDNFTLSRESRFNMNFALGIQIDFKESVSKMIFKEIGIS